MQSGQADIINKLQRDILSLQGYQRLPAEKNVHTGLGEIEYAFPGNCFPLGAVHEFITEGKNFSAATNAFVATLAGAIMSKQKISVWLSQARTVFPPALKTFGIQPDKIIFINLKNQKQSLWVMEEALKCEGLATVIAEISNFDFTASRRLQLAVEKSRVTGFIIRNKPKSLGANACVARWKISSLQSVQHDELPGIGFPRWNIELLKIRNGKPGSWQVQWSAGKFEVLPAKEKSISIYQTRKTG